MANTVLRLLMILLLSFQPSVLMAKTKVSPKKTAEISKRGLETSLDYFIREYQQTATPERFVERFLGGFSKEDQKTFLQAFKGLKVLPKIERQHQSLLFTDSKKQQMRFEIVSLQERQYRINGELWTYLPRTSLKEHVRMLQQKVSEKVPPAKSSRLILLELLQPEAQALAPLALVAISAAIGALVSNGVMDPALRVGSNVFCDTTNEKIGWDTTKVDLCVDWKKRRTEASRVGRGKLDGIEKMIATDQSNVLGKFKVLNEYSCAENNDGKERLYVADVQVKETGHRLSVMAKFTPEGKTVEVRINEYRSEKVLAQLQFDSENYLTCALLPNEEAAKDPLTGQNVSLCFTQNLTSEERTKLSFLEDTTRFVNLRVTRCNVQEAAEAVAKGEIPASPLGPAAEAAGTPPPPTEGQK